MTEKFLLLDFIINTLFIITLAPIINAIWIALSKRNTEISNIEKLNLGVVFAAIPFSVMMLTSYFALNSGYVKVSPLWLL